MKNTTMSHPSIVISGSGIWTPEHVITNEELVDSYNAYAEKFNSNHAAKIKSGEMEEKPFSSARFIEKASGIKTRYVHTKEGILDIDRMCPKIAERNEEEISLEKELEN